MSRLSVALTALGLLLAAAPARAQNRDAFVEATLQFVQASDGSFGDEGRYMRSAVDAMARVLSEWDATLARERTEATPLAVAALEIERGRFQRALDALDGTAAQSPADPAAFLLRSLALDRLGRADAATAVYRDAWRRFPDALAAAYRVALAPAATPALQADRAAALEALTAAVRRPSSRLRFVVPTDHLLEDASAQAPLLPLARYAAAFALVEQGRYDEAVSALRAAVDRDPLTHAPPEVVAAAGALRVGDWFGALDRLASTTADTAEVHRVRASAHLASGEVAKALVELSAAIQLDPSDERARLTAADLLARAGRAADAALTLREASRQIPRSLRARWQIAQTAIAAEDWLTVVDALLPVAASRPLAGAGGVYATLARAYTSRGDRAGVVRALKNRVEVLPHSTAAHTDLGGAYRSTGQLFEARVEFQVALLLDASNETARAALEALK